MENVNVNVLYRINERKNSYLENGKEWNLDIKIEATRFSSWWTVISYDEKPSHETVEKDLFLINRSINVYADSIKMTLPKVSKIEKCGM